MNLILPHRRVMMVPVYEAFKESVLDASSVLYPCCGSDDSPSLVFSNVTYVDDEKMHPESMAEMRKRGLKAHKMDVRRYTASEEHDMLIILRPMIPTRWAAQHIKPGALILSDDYHGNAREMRDNPRRYTLIGGISHTPGAHPLDFRATLTLDVTDMLVPCSCEEELKRLRPDKHREISILYPQIMRMAGHEAPENFIEMVMRYYRNMGWRLELPARREADYYIFRKG